MSTMKWTFKGTKDAFTPNADKITVTEYEFYMDNRGGSSSTTTQYYEGNVPPRNVHEGSQYSPPQGKQLKLGEDFTFESQKKDIGNNKTVMYLGFIVAGYFIYKYMLKK